MVGVVGYNLNNLLCAMPRTSIKPWELPGVNPLPHKKGTRVHALVKLYLQSDSYRTLAIASKRQYTSCLCNLEKFTLPTGGTIFDMYAHACDYGLADYLKRVMAFAIKPATIKLHFAVLKTVWEFGLKTGRVAYNPWARPNIRISNFRDMTWNPEQIQLAIDAANNLGYNVLALYIHMAYTTAQRPFSDLRHMKWSNLKVDADGTPFLDFIIQKTNTHLILPLDKRTYNLLMSLERKSEYIFVSDKGSLLTGACITQQFKKVKKYAMLDDNLMIRDLRRSAVTEMAMAGATPMEIEAITGWHCTEAMLKRYAPMRFNTAKNALEKREAMRNANAISNSSEILREPTSIK